MARMTSAAAMAPENQPKRQDRNHVQRSFEETRLPSTTKKSEVDQTCFVLYTTQCSADSFLYSAARDLIQHEMLWCKVAPQHRIFTVLCLQGGSRVPFIQVLKQPVSNSSAHKLYFTTRTWRSSQPASTPFSFYLLRSLTDKNAYFAGVSGVARTRESISSSTAQISGRFLYFACGRR
jgi:hypothetical protein